VELRLVGNFSINGEQTGDAARFEFHRRRMAYFLRLVKEKADPTLWSELRATQPDLLTDTPTAGRSIEWASIDSAEMPVFGRTQASDLPPPPDFTPPRTADAVPADTQASRLVAAAGSQMMLCKMWGAEKHMRFCWVTETKELCWGKKKRRMSGRNLSDSDEIAKIQASGDFGRAPITGVLPSAPQVRWSNQERAFSILTRDEQLILVAKDEWTKDAWVLAMEELLERA
jgi:hypothetical protein